MLYATTPEKKANHDAPINAIVGLNGDFISLLVFFVSIFSFCKSIFIFFANILFIPTIQF